MSLPKSLDTLKQALTGPRARIGLGKKSREAILNTFETLAHDLEILQQENENNKKRLQLQRAQDETDKSRFDAFYLNFENRFRGTEESVALKTSFYLSELDSLELDKSSAPIYDLGCGRGEWLALLKDAGYSKAMGVDANADMIATCREKNLRVKKGDALAFIKLVEPSSVSVITGYHIIEHMPFEDLLRLLRYCFDALAPGGIAIFETPNPGNIIVGTNTFHFDPTHLKPIPIQLLTAAGEFVGLRKKAVHQRNPYPDLLTMAEAIPESAAAFKRMFDAGLDYGLVFEKPAKPAAS